MDMHKERVLISKVGENAASHLPLDKLERPVSEYLILAKSSLADLGDEINERV